MQELKPVILKCYLLEISKCSLKVEEFVCINTCVCTSWEQSSWLRLLSSVQFGQSLSHVRLIVTPWTAARQASLSVTNSQSLLKHISIESVMPSNHLILRCPLLFLPSIFTSIRVFSRQSLFASDGQSIRTSASVLPMNVQSWFLLGLTGLISLQSRELSGVFSSTTVQRHQFFGLSILYGPTLISVYDNWKNHSFD